MSSKNQGWCFLPWRSPTAPLVPLTIVALTSTPYPPPQGLPPLPNTDKLNHLLGVLVSASTIPTAPPTRRSERPQNKRTSDIYVYSSVVAAPTTPILMPYLAIVHGDMGRISTPHLTPVEVADAAWLCQNALTARSSSMMMWKNMVNNAGTSMIDISFRGLYIFFLYILRINTFLLVHRID